MPFSPIPLSPFPCHLCQQGGTIRQPNTTLCTPINRITRNLNLFRISRNKFGKLAKFYFGVFGSEKFSPHPASAGFVPAVRRTPKLLLSGP